MAERLASGNFSGPDATGQVTIDFKSIEKREDESLPPPERTVEPPLPPQTSQLYVYKNTPFSACVEWPEVVEDDCYLAGVWRIDIWVGLSWYRNPYGPVGTRSTYRAPTWSWASLDCAGVRFHGNPNQYTRSENGLAFASDLELLDARVTLAGLNPFGQVRSGRLVILGRIVDLPFFDDEYGCAHPRIDGVDLGDNLGMMIRDDSDRLSVHCKCIVIDHATNLVVEPVTLPNGAQAYRRLGLWMRDMRDNTILEDNRDSPKEMIFLI